MQAGIILFFAAFFLPCLRLLLRRFCYLLLRPEQIRRAFSGKTVLMTGGTNGLGAKAALELAAAGTKLVLVGRDAKRVKHDLLPRLISELDDRAKWPLLYDREDLDGRVVDLQNGKWDGRGNFSSAALVFLRCDIGSREEIEAAFGRLKAAGTKVDFLLNNAGMLFAEDSASSPESPNQVFKVNLVAPLVFSQLAAAGFSGPQGLHVINSGCVLGGLTEESLAGRGSRFQVYRTSKQLLVQASSAINARLRQLAVGRCSLVCPPTCMTGFWLSGAPLLAKCVYWVCSPLLWAMSRSSEEAAHEYLRRIIELTDGRAPSKPPLQACRRSAQLLAKIESAYSLTRWSTD